MKLFVCLFLVTYVISSVLSFPASPELSSDQLTGYEHCPKGKPGKINVHLVPHSHDDVGWLKTVDQYFYGALQPIQRAGVQYIIDSVIQSLRNDPQKKFIYVEMAFFSRWWHQQHDAMKEIVKKLVCNGQLEFINGGWSMNDEAGSHYNQIIDQMSWGLRFLNDTFGKCGLPKVAWQIDPFGHSREMASIFAEMFFDGLFFGRLDFEDKNLRLETKTMEHIWKGNPVLGTHSDLFTGALHNGYDPPPGFCFDIMCNDPPIMDDPNLKNYNVEFKVMAFLDHAELQSKYYATKNIIMTMGSDFHYQNAATWFKNLDKLIYHVNRKQENGSNVHTFYSTPSCYLYALNKANINWTVKFDDFFPYSSDPHAFWTGYFSSRPSLKRYDKIGNIYLQACKQLLSRTEINETSLNILRDAVGIMQHHDAITGTAKQHVTDDYYQTLATAIRKGQDVISNAYSRLLPLTEEVPPKQLFCNYLNISSCKVTEEGLPAVVTIYNPLAWNISTYIRLPVVQKSYKVVDPTGNAIDVQVIPLSTYVLNIPGRESKATSELVFQADLPALGHASYIIRNTTTIFYTHVMDEQKSVVKAVQREPFTMSNKHLSVTIGKSGLLESIQLADGSKLAVNQSFYWYRGMTGDNLSPNLRASGAYIFRPNGTEPIPLGNNVSVAYVNGSLVQEIHQVFTPWLAQTIRLYYDQENVELNWVVGPIPVADEIGKEIIMRFDTDMVTEKHFYTDANGRQILERVRDYRPTWKLNISEPVSGNYYPVNSRIFLRDKRTNRQFTVLNDRSQGGSSIKDGSLELMLHRRLLVDDAFGVEEALNETGEDGRGLCIIGTHHLIFSNMETAASRHRTLAQYIYLQPVISFMNLNNSEASYMQRYKMESSALKRPLPDNVHLLTLEPWKDKTLLIRLEHIYDFNEDPKLSKPVKIDMKDLFADFTILSLVETTLGGNQYLDEAKRLQWKTQFSYHIFEEETPKERKGETDDLLRDLVVSLTPLKIRTFIAEIRLVK